MRIEHVFTTVALFAGCGGPSGQPSFRPANDERPFAAQVELVRKGRTDRILAELPPSDEEWESLRGLAGLRELVLADGRADDGRAGILASLPDIERLVLRSSPLSDDGFRSLATCTTLRDLNVPQAACTADGVRALADLPRLGSLRIGSPRLAGREACEAIVALKQLRTLHLIDVPIGDDGLGILAGRPDLWSLYLDGAGASNAAWEDYFRACRGVHVHIDQMHHDRDPARGHE